ncbi:hypothetical protein [Desulfitobacterium hafniense]|uniref:hypothetical protein n=1 Tax=Desulfitobacterium hafniense TaxID=49338 RepID=UPI00035CB37A|nr:hypothetical protein [Desulfitobacterium hafniense]
MFDRDLQRAAARYTTAKTVEVYAGIAMVVVAVSVVVTVGFRVVQSIASTFGL